MEARKLPTRETPGRVLFSVLVLAATVVVLADANSWCIILVVVGVGILIEMLLMKFREDPAAEMHNMSRFWLVSWPLALLVAVGIVSGFALYSVSPLLAEVAVYSAYVNDVAALVFGRLLGRQYINKMFWPFSPKKTWEGTIGGIVTAMGLVGATYSIFAALQHEETWPRWFVLSLVASLGAVASDMLGSTIKRSAGVKDSAPGVFAKLWLGHGGCLDRFLAVLGALACTAAATRLL